MGRELRRRKNGVDKTEIHEFFQPVNVWGETSDGGPDKKEREKSDIFDEERKEVVGAESG